MLPFCYQVEYDVIQGIPVTANLKAMFEDLFSAFEPHS